MLDKTTEQWLIARHMGLDELDAITRHLAESYVRYRRVKYPLYRPTDAMMSMGRWRKIAMFVKDANADPDEWLRVLFDAIQPYPEIGKLGCASALATFRAAFDSGVVQQVSDELRIFSQIWVDRRKTNNNDPRFILTDPRAGLGALFVWCMAVTLGLDDVAKEYRGRARILLHKPAYFKVYSSVFTKLKEAFSECVSH